MLGLKRYTLQVVDHDSGWAALAVAACQEIRLAGGDWLAEVQHVGSTAVAGLPAKPILDLAAGLRTLRAIPEAIRLFAEIGYLYRGDQRDDSGHLFVKESAPDIRTIHLHVIEYNGREWKNYIFFRDQLRQSAQLRAEYAALKQQLAAELGNNREAYTAAKQDFIQEVLRKRAPGI
jgi:GrpB-like predicted nucleotidyltransferase (UPF0157 family)